MPHPTAASLALAYPTLAWTTRRRGSRTYHHGRTPAQWLLVVVVESPDDRRCEARVRVPYLRVFADFGVGGVAAVSRAFQEVRTCAAAGLEAVDTFAPLTKDPA